MDVSENRGIPKSSILIGFSIINHPFWGYHYFWKHPYNAISAYLYICVHGGLRTHPPLPGAMVDSTRSLTIQTSTFTNQTPTSWKQLKYGFGSSLKTKETCKTQTISGLYHSILCRPLDGFYRNRIFLQIQLADPFFSHLVSSIHDDKILEITLEEIKALSDTSGLRRMKTAVAWTSGSISTITDTSRLLWIPIFISICI